MYQNHRVSAIHWSKLWPNGWQSSSTVRHRKAPAVHIYPKSPSLRIWPGYNQGSSKHWYRDRHRNRRCTGFSIRPQFRSELGGNQRGPLLPGEQDHSHRRGKRGNNLWRPQFHVAALAGYEKCPKCTRGSLSRRQNKGINSTHNVDSEPVRPSFGRGVCCRPCWYIERVARV